MKYSLCGYDCFRKGHETSLSYYELRCSPCNVKLKNPPICDLIGNKTVKLTVRACPLSGLSEEQLIIKLDDVKSFVNESRRWSLQPAWPLRSFTVSCPISTKDWAGWTDVSKRIKSLYLPLRI
ncbi:hypothetical protein RvY_00198-2 [Ramazzottius varieornatus]|uniref:Uncharacterized protein n=1 Tax=Ramazzottius varieornatus TaxID=947166 RepID=A0A1D1UG21_RAMVA|nr:hypothetical protein RvY_00198-2 [Ramazzottius varieornatus]